MSATEYRIMMQGSFTDEEYDNKSREIKNRLNSVMEEYSSKGYMPILKVRENSDYIEEVILVNKTLRHGEESTEDGKPIYLDPPTYDSMP